VARLDLGCYAIFGGMAGTTGATELMASVVRPREIILPEDQEWRDLAHEVHGARLEDRPMRTYSGHELDAERLASLVAAAPAEFTIEPLGPRLAAQLDTELEPHALQAFPDIDDFVARGMGFGAVCGGRLVGAASSYALSSLRVEVAVATRPAFRRRGLARAVAAAMLVHCLRDGLRPEWSAANPASKRLALALGYLPGPICDSLYLREDGGAD
jgi:GNAT superfamily N-acetyltransferase